MTEVIVVERRIAAPPSAVYSYLTVSERWCRWQGRAAMVEARPGGSLLMTMPDGLQASGRFLELVPHERVVFSWGWIGHPGLPPGASTVEIDLVAENGGTRLTLTHRGLPADELLNHRAGWSRYVPRLAAAAEGEDPGPDGGPPAAPAVSDEDPVRSA